MTTTDTQHQGQGTTDTPISIIELWQRWLALTDTYHAASNPETHAAKRVYGAAKLLALCLACLPATCMDDIRFKVVVAAWLKRYGDTSHAELMIEAAIAADHEALQPPIDRELH